MISTGIVEKDSSNDFNIHIILDCNFPSDHFSDVCVNVCKYVYLSYEHNYFCTRKFLKTRSFHN